MSPNKQAPPPFSLGNLRLNAGGEANHFDRRFNALMGDSPTFGSPSSPEESQQRLIRILDAAIELLSDVDEGDRSEPKRSQQ